LSEEILEDRYRRGDYAVFLSWHDPWDAQFDQHGTYAYPLGLKCRLRLGERFRVEGDFSYYSRGGDPSPFLPVVEAPGIDAVMLNVTLQSLLLTQGLIRPYVGGGAAFVSIGRDFVVEIREVPPNTSFSRTQLASWSEKDVGLQVVGGVDIALTRRVFPFVEYRHLFGELGIDSILIGVFEYSVDELQLPDGAGVASAYDFSGPIVMVGLKIRF
jgi:opacity protein-like surface antigen